MSIGAARGLTDDSRQRFTSLFTLPYFYGSKEFFHQESLTTLAKRRRFAMSAQRAKSKSFSTCLPFHFFPVYVAKYPPSTCRICPVTIAEASEARKTAGPRKSSGFEMPSGTLFEIDCRRSRSSSKDLTISVSTTHGLMALTRMPCLAHSTAKARVSAFTPPLVAE